MDRWFGLSEILWGLIGLGIGVGSSLYTLGRKQAQQLAAAQRKVQTLTHQLQTTCADQEQQTEVLHMQHATVQQQKAQLELLQQQANERDAKLAAQAHQLSKQQNALAAQMQRQHILQAELVTTKTEHAAALQQRDQIAVRLLRERDETVQQLQHILQLRNQEAEEARAETAEKIRERDQLAETLRDLELTNYALKRQIDELLDLSRNDTTQASALQTEFINLQKSSSTLQQRHEALLKDRASKAEQLYTLEGQLDEQRERELTLRKAVTKHVDALSQLLTGDMPSSIPTIKRKTDTAYAVTPAQNMTKHQWPVPVQTDPGKLLTFLAAHNIAIEELPNGQSKPQIDRELEILAYTLATHYNLLKPLHRRIKQSLNTGNAFTLRLDGNTADAIKRICDFGQTAQRLGLLAFFSYKSPHVRAKSNNTAQAQSFFSGAWLERYIVQQVQFVVDTIRAEQGQRLDFAYIPNAKVRLPNNALRELDLLFHINEHFYWVEVKSSGYRQFIQKYAELSALMQLDQKHAILVVAELTHRHALFREDHPINIYAMHEFANRLSVTIRDDLL